MITNVVLIGLNVGVAYGGLMGLASHLFDPLLRWYLIGMGVLGTAGILRKDETIGQLFAGLLIGLLAGWLVAVLFSFRPGGGGGGEDEDVDSPPDPPGGHEPSPGGDGEPVPVQRPTIDWDTWEAQFVSTSAEERTS